MVGGVFDAPRFPRFPLPNFPVDLCPGPPDARHSNSHGFLNDQVRLALTVIDRLRNAAEECFVCGDTVDRDVPGPTACSKVRLIADWKAGEGMWARVTVFLM